jgi:hypothetical protein
VRPLVKNFSRFPAVRFGSLRFRAGINRNRVVDCSAPARPTRADQTATLFGATPYARVRCAGAPDHSRSSVCLRKTGFAGLIWISCPVGLRGSLLARTAVVLIHHVSSEALWILAIHWVASFDFAGMKSASGSFGVPHLIKRLDVLDLSGPSRKEVGAMLRLGRPFSSCRRNYFRGLPRAIPRG